jgi:hypothetical protein
VPDGAAGSCAGLDLAAAHRIGREGKRLERDRYRTKSAAPRPTRALARAGEKKTLRAGHESTATGNTNAVCKQSPFFAQLALSVEIIADS